MAHSPPNERSSGLLAHLGLLARWAYGITRAPLIVVPQRHRLFTFSTSSQKPLVGLTSNFVYMVLTTRGSKIVNHEILKTKMAARQPY